MASMHADEPPHLLTAVSDVSADKLGHETAHSGADRPVSSVAVSDEALSMPVSPLGARPESSVVAVSAKPLSTTLWGPVSTAPVLVPVVSAPDGGTLPQETSASSREESI